MKEISGPHFEYAVEVRILIVRQLPLAGYVDSMQSASSHSHAIALRDVLAIIDKAAMDTGANILAESLEVKRMAIDGR